jgi:hypothetical protein
MSNALIQVQESIERTIYEKIRLELVSTGYLPDITDNLAYPNNSVGKFEFEKAMGVIQATKGFCIELFGVGSIKSRGLKKVPRIVIKKGRLLPGGIGSPPGLNYIPNPANENFDGVLLPQRSTDYYIDICLISNEETQDRVMNNVIGNTLTTRTYLALIDNPTQRFFIEQIGYNEMADIDEGIMERVYQYQIPDLYLTQATVQATASVIKDITLEQENIPDTEINHTTPNP